MVQNRSFEQTWKNILFFLIKEGLSTTMEQTFKKKIVFFTERAILLTEQFYWTNDFTERKNWLENKRKRWKMNYSSDNEQIK